MPNGEGQKQEVNQNEIRENAQENTQVSTQTNTQANTQTNPQANTQEQQDIQEPQEIRYTDRVKRSVDKYARIKRKDRDYLDMGIYNNRAGDAVLLVYLMGVKGMDFEKMKSLEKRDARDVIDLEKAFERCEMYWKQAGQSGARTGVLTKMTMNIVQECAAALRKAMDQLKKEGIKMPTWEELQDPEKFRELQGGKFQLAYELCSCFRELSSAFSSPFLRIRFTKGYGGVEQLEKDLQMASTLGAVGDMAEYMHSKTVNPQVAQAVGEELKKNYHSIQGKSMEELDSKDCFLIGEPGFFMLEGIKYGEGKMSEPEKAYTGETLRNLRRKDMKREIKVGIREIDRSEQPLVKGNPLHDKEYYPNIKRLSNQELEREATIFDRTFENVRLRELPYLNQVENMDISQNFVFDGVSVDSYVKKVIGSGTAKETLAKYRKAFVMMAVEGNVDSFLQYAPCSVDEKGKVMTVASDQKYDYDKVNAERSREARKIEGDRKKQEEADRKLKEEEEKRQRELKEAQEKRQRELKEAQEKRQRELKEAQEKAEREAREKRQRELKEAQEKAEREAREKRQRELKEAQEKAEREAQEKRQRELKEAQEKAEREEEEKRQRELKEAQEKAEREQREREEREAQERREREERERVERERVERERVERERVEREARERQEREDARLRKVREDAENVPEIRARVEATKNSRFLLQKMISFKIYDAFQVKEYVEDPLWGTGIDPNLSQEQIQEALRKAKEENPDLFRRRENIEKALKLLVKWSQFLGTETGQRFMSSVDRGTDEWKLMDLGESELLTELINAKGIDIEDYSNILDHVLNDEMFKLEEFRNPENLKDKEIDFWLQLGRIQIEMGDVNRILNKAESLETLGVDWEQVIEAGVYEDILKDNPQLRILGNVNPFSLMVEMRHDPQKIREFRETYDSRVVTNLEALLGEVEDRVKAKAEQYADSDAPSQIKWFFTYGREMMLHSPISAMGYEETLDGPEMIRHLRTGFKGVDVDWDRITGERHAEMLENVRRAQTLYNSLQDKIQKLGKAEGFGPDGQKNPQALQDLYLDLNLRNHLNEFRRLMYQLKPEDTRICKIGDDRTPQIVKPLEKNVTFDRNRLDQEAQILDSCYHMLEEASHKVWTNSGEYNRLMESVKSTRDLLRTTPEGENARREYSRAVYKVLEDINTYRQHKADQGIKNDGTRYKLMACERIDKLLRTRYESLEQRSFQDERKPIADLFEVTVRENLTGDAFVLAKAVSKIMNRNKTLEQLQQEEAERAARRLAAEQEAAQEAAMLQEEGLGGAGGGQLQSENLRANHFRQGRLVSSLLEKEEIYRQGLDPANAVDKSRLILSAEKSLYVEAMVTLAEKSVHNMGRQETEDILRRGISELNHSEDPVQSWKAKSLQSEVFRKEFERLVLEGKADGRIQHQNIVTFRDQALVHAFVNAKIADVPALEEMAQKMGSEIHFGSAQVQYAMHPEYAPDGANLQVNQAAQGPQ